MGDQDGKYPSGWSHRRRRMVDMMTADHRQLEELTKTLREQALAGDWGGATHTHRRLVREYNRHQQMEDKQLLPLLRGQVEQRHMRILTELDAEHHEVDDLILGVGHVLTGNPDRAGMQLLSRQTAELEMCLISHVGKEERMLYGWLDVILGDEEMDELLVRLARTAGWDQALGFSD